MLHDPFFWSTAVLGLLHAIVVGLFVWAARQPPREPKPDFDAEISIGNEPGRVCMKFSRPMTSMNMDTGEARHMASVINRAADDADARADVKVERVTAWERINRD